MADKSKNSIKAPVLGFYWKKFFFFIFVSIFAVVAFESVKPFSADTSKYSPSASINSLNIYLEVQPDGSLQVDGKKIKDRVNTISDGEEIRFPIIDNTGSYYYHVQVTMTLPKGVAADTIYEFKGIHGVGSTNSYSSSSNTIILEAYDVSPSATLSVIAQMPKGTVSQPLVYKLYYFLGTVKTNFWLALALILPLITLGFMFLFISYQVKREKIDMPTEENSAPPMALPPAIVGVLYHQKVGPREIAATLIDLALRGNIYILDRERDFAFAKNRFDSRLLSYEKLLLSKIFKKNIVSDKTEIEQRINNHIYSKKISLVTAGIYVIATRLGYFKSNPQGVHFKYRLIGMISFFLGLAGLVLSVIYFTNPPYIAFFWLGMMASALIITFTAHNIPNRTVLGQEGLSNWLAFRKYLTNVEKVPFSYDSQSLFQKYLPYAIVLDCEAAWAKRFSEQNFNIPDWYLSDHNGIGLQDFCLSLFPLVSYVARSLAAIREPGFE